MNYLVQNLFSCTQPISQGWLSDFALDRLNQLMGAIHLPPLRERSTDIPDLSRHFLQKYAVKNHKDIKRFHPEVLNLFVRYNWPGNIREFENTIERAVILCLGEQITPHELPVHLLPEGVATPVTQAMDSGPTLRDMEQEFIRTTLLQLQTGGNKS